MNEASGIYTKLGAGILLREDSHGPMEVNVGGVIYFRFMDRIYLPTTTDRLSADQIKVINRFREREIITGPGLAYRNRVRGLTKAVVSAIGQGGLMEIGCGNFPLSAEIPLKAYQAVEIDDHAIAENQRRGILCTRDIEIEPSIVRQCDLCVALFVFHFHVENTTYELIVNNLPDNSVLIFNVVSRHPEIRTRVALELIRRGLWLGSLELTSLGACDVMYFAAREPGVARALAARRHAVGLLPSPLTGQQPY